MGGCCVLSVVLQQVVFHSNALSLKSSAQSARRQVKLTYDGTSESKHVAGSGQHSWETSARLPSEVRSQSLWRRGTPTVRPSVTLLNSRRISTPEGKHAHLDTPGR